METITNGFLLASLMLGGEDGSFCPPRMLPLMFPDPLIGIFIFVNQLMTLYYLSGEQM